MYSISLSAAKFSTMLATTLAPKSICCYLCGHYHLQEKGRKGMGREGHGRARKWRLTDSARKERIWVFKFSFLTLFFNPSEIFSLLYEAGICLNLFPSIAINHICWRVCPFLCFRHSSFGCSLYKDTTQECKNSSCLTLAREQESQELRALSISQEPSSFSPFMGHKTYSSLLFSVSF